jgi:hypothetical protein
MLFGALGIAEDEGNVRSVEQSGGRQRHEIASPPQVPAVKNGEEEEADQKKTVDRLGVHGQAA